MRDGPGLGDLEDGRVLDEVTAVPATHGLFDTSLASSCPRCTILKPAATDLIFGGSDVSACVAAMPEPASKSLAEIGSLLENDSVDATVLLEAAAAGITQSCVYITCPANAILDTAIAGRRIVTNRVFIGIPSPDMRFARNVAFMAKLRILTAVIRAVCAF